MIKAILFLFNLVGIYLCGLLFPSSITLSQTAPSTAEINNSVLVQVTINKGDLSGMGKFAEQLPAGFNAVAIDDEGAQTSFDSNTIVFSWNSLPSDAILNISFRVDITSSAAIQNDVLTGRFFYTANGQNSETDCNPSNITITNGSVAQGNTSSGSSMPQNNIIAQNNSIPQSNSVPQNTPQNSTQSQGNSSPQVQNTTTSSGRVFVVRQFSSTTITPKTGTKVIFTIHKNGITGFAKIEDSIPPGFTASQGDLNGASFTFIDGRAKFVWDNLPSDSVFTVSYLISANSNVPGTHVVVGNFSYIDNANNPSSISIGSSVFNSSIIPGYDIAAEKGKNPPPAPPSSPANTVAAAQTSPANTTQNSNTPAANSPDNTAAPQTASTSPVANTTQTSNPSTPANVTPANNTTTTVSNTNNQPAEAANTNTASSSKPEAIPAAVPAATSNITYKVQIMALRNPVPASYFVSRKKIKEHVTTEVEGGLTKYTIGNYTDYKSVKDEKDNLKNQGFEGAFVVCYKSGMRITLQEALKISHQ